MEIDSYHAISSIRSLLNWLNNYGHLKDIVLKKAEEAICSVLSDDERWTLFEEKIIKSPGDANIRKRLDIAYKKKYGDSGYIWLAPPSSVTTRQCSSELDTALAAPSVGDALIINCVPDDKMSRMANPEGVISVEGHTPPQVFRISSVESVIKVGYMYCTCGGV